MALEVGTSHPQGTNEAVTLLGAKNVSMDTSLDEGFNSIPHDCSQHPSFPHLRLKPVNKVRHLPGVGLGRKRPQGSMHQGLPSTVTLNKYHHDQPSIVGPGNGTLHSPDAFVASALWIGPSSP